MFKPSRAARRRYRVVALATAVVPVAFCHTASADEYWINGVPNGFWNTAANWNTTSATGGGTGSVPGGTDNVFLQNTLASAFTTTFSVTNDSIMSLTIGDTATGGSDTLSQTSNNVMTISQNLNIGSMSGSTGSYLASTGTLSVGGNAYLGGSSSGAGGTGTLTIGSNVYITGTLKIYAGGVLDQPSTGSILTSTLSAGSITQVGGSVTLPYLDVDGAVSPVTGSYSLSGGSFSDTGYAYVGLYGTGTFNQTGGTAAIGDDLNVGGGSTGKGTYGVSGASSLSVGGNAYLGTETAGTIGGAGTLTVGAGSVNIAGSAYLGGSANGAGTLTVGGGTLNIVGGAYLGGNGGGSGTITLSSGTLSIAQTVFIYAGGTLKQAGGSYQFGNGNSSTGVTQSGGSAAFETLAIAQSLGPGTVEAYRLSGGSLSTSANEEVGLGSEGIFTQSGGANSVSGDLIVGDTSVGFFNLSAGTLAVTGVEQVGVASGGSFSTTFTQSGGVHTIGTTGSPQELDIGLNTATYAGYLLSGSGSLTVNGPAVIGGTTTGGNGLGSV